MDSSFLPLLGFGFGSLKGTFLGFGTSFSGEENDPGAESCSFVLFFWGLLSQLPIVFVNDSRCSKSFVFFTFWQCFSLRWQLLSVFRLQYAKLGGHVQNSDYNNIAFFPKCLTINSLDEGRTCFATYRWTVRPISDFWGHDCSVFKGVSSYLHN